MASRLKSQPSRDPVPAAPVAPADTLSALYAQALACHQAGQFAEAIARYRRILALKPDLSEIHNNMGLALAELSRLDAAVESYRRAIELKPDNPQTLCNWGTALAQLERFDEAEAKFRRAIALDPGCAGAYNNLGLSLKERGRLAEATSAAEQAIRLAPKNPSYYEHLGAVRSFVPGDRHVAALEALADDPASLRTVERMHLHFALAKAYDDIGRPQAAFPQWLAANALKRRQIAYDEAATLGRMDRTRALFRADFVASRQGCGARSPLPVFIVGMPRSGTTLIEQILASHPEVCGAGELTLFEEAADAVREALPGAPPGPEMVAAMSRDHLRAVGARYLDKLAQRAPGAARITDKLPGNFIFTGLIHLAMPDATIIHAVRDPLDTCLSCFCVHFTKGQPHTYDLAELGRYYRHYRALMAHWRRALPAQRVMDVHYEQLVGDLEGQARRIIAHCGLAWDARCLDFHRTERPVRTASAAQVRQPIYASSVGRWRPYRDFLGPLIGELEAA